LKPNHHHPFQFCSVTTVKNQTVIARVHLETKHVYKTHLLRKVNHFKTLLYVTIGFVLLATVGDENRSSSKTTTEMFVRPVLTVPFPGTFGQHVGRFRK
jgi:hypothetical protein